MNVVRVTLTTCLLALTAACGGSSESAAPPSSAPTPTPAPLLISGTITLLDGGTLYTGDAAEGCSGQDGYDDMKGGLQVVVYDDASKIVATSQLSSGAPQGVTENPGGTTASYSSCRFTFTVADVPERPFYQLEVGTRGRQTIQRANASTPLSLTLG